MITLSHDDFRGLIAEARLAPSVHNVQPSRWRMRDGAIELLGDRARSIPVADPAGRDWRLSHGAAFEGLAIALARKGLRIEPEIASAASQASTPGPLETIAFGRLTSGSVAETDQPVADRVSWRGKFGVMTAETDARLDRLAMAQPDVQLIRAPDAIESAARLADQAGMHFLRDPAHRRELLQWMRLRRTHPDFERDGLNAVAMDLGVMEATGAGVVLGALFGALDAIGMAAPLMSELAKTRTAAAIALFHRPAGEDPFTSGRAFYRAWLAMETAGLKGCPMSVLADWPQSRAALHDLHGLGADRFIVSAFRIGIPASTPLLAHARLPVDELIV